MLRKKGTERPFTGEYVNTKDDGTYMCAACGQPLFSSDTKFDSGTGWPSFTAPVAEETVETEADNSLFMRRTEVLCSRCDSHLGHVFDDGPERDAALLHQLLLPGAEGERRLRGVVVSRAWPARRSRPGPAE